MSIETCVGKLTFLRAHDVGTGWGAAPDALDVEVIFRLTGAPDLAFGFTLRNDTNSAAHRGMLDLLRDAFTHNWTVTTDYDIGPGKKNGRAFRVALTK